MRRLVIHLGYPKAASTTLQNALFFKLHQEGRIHFVGRAFESGYFGPAANKKDYKSWFRAVCDPTTPADEKPDIPSPLVDGKLNLLSEGLFVNHERRGDTIAIAERLVPYFASRSDHLRLLFVIRNQQTLVRSDYVQRYRKIKKGTIGEYVTENLRLGRDGQFGVFDFAELIGSYAAIVGKENITIAFFEDLSKDISRFSTDIGAAIGVDPGVVRGHLESSHLNRTPSAGAGSVVRRHGKITIRKWLEQTVLGKKVVVPEMPDREQELVSETFRDSNRRLARDFGLDSERMSAYGYF